MSPRARHKRYLRNAERFSEENRARYAAKGAAKHRQRTYGLSPEEHDRMLAAQNGACAICKTIPSKFHVDHCHLTGRVRGLLCPACNTGVGHVERFAAAGLDASVQQYLS